MNNSITSRSLRAALFAFSGSLLLALAACNNGYGPPSPDQSSLTWGQQHYVDNQAAQADHDSRRSDVSDHMGPGLHGVR
jgi:hypothetical protein